MIPFSKNSMFQLHDEKLGTDPRPMSRKEVAGDL